MSEMNDFGKVKSGRTVGRNSPRVTVALDPEMLEEIGRRAVKNERFMSGEIRTLLQRALDLPENPV